MKPLHSLAKKLFVDTLRDPELNKHLQPFIEKGLESLWEKIEDRRRAEGLLETQSKKKLPIPKITSPKPGLDKFYSLIKPCNE